MLSALTTVLNMEVHLSHNEHLLCDVANAPPTTKPAYIFYTRDTLFHHAHFLYALPSVVF